MSTTTDVVPVPAVRNDWLQLGAVTGALFGVGFGLLGTVAGFLPEVGAIIGMPTLVGGWLLHLTLSFVVSITFAAILSTARFSGSADRLRTVLPVGLAVGVLSAVVLDMFVLAYLATVFEAPGAVFPNFAVEDWSFSLVLGVLIALVYYVTRRWVLTARPARETTAE